MNTNEATHVIVDGNILPVHFAARLIASNIHRTCHVEIGNVLCPVWPTVVKDGSLDFVRFHDASGSVRAKAKV